MKPAPFVYHDPRSLGEACELLATHEDARVLAGGQSLMPMMNFRAVAPGHLVDLNRIGELAYLRIGSDRIEIGAMTRQCELERSVELAERCPVWREALAHVGHVQTRNRGTLGGSLCHLDPSAELVNLMALLDGTLQAVSRRGRRDIAFADFASGYLTTSLQADELLVGAAFALPPAECGYGFCELARRRGDFAIVACSAWLALNDRGDIAQAALAVSGLGYAPVRPAPIERALEGQKPGPDAFKAAAAEAGRLPTQGDAFVTAAYRQHLARILAYRALESALAQARERSHG